MKSYCFAPTLNINLRCNFRRLWVKLYEEVTTSETNSESTGWKKKLNLVTPSSCCQTENSRPSGVYQV